MRENKVVHFVYFETSLKTERFIRRWEEYGRSVNSDLDVTLQQSEKDGVFRYIAQHRCSTDALQFVFTKPARSSRIPQEAIKTKHAGGYSVLQAERMDDAHVNESKVFAFIIYPQADLNAYRQLTANGKLNIYEAYYENCEYAYILEFFVKTKYVEELLEQLKQHNAAVEIGIYQEFVPATV